MFFERRIPRKGEFILFKESLCEVIDLNDNSIKISSNSKNEILDITLANYRVVNMYPYFKFW